ncbi:MAG TPA: hypothetical protein IAA05_00470, partial [Candidatus Blautia excrementipullorum]|nr:hypothetical protein [Candidatus Blautia excrementipullorum]
FVWQLNFTSKRNRIPYILAIFSKLWITKPSRFILGDNSAETQECYLPVADWAEKKGLRIMIGTALLINEHLNKIEHC